MKSFDIEERVNQAVHNFESGYNCAQSVFLAYSDVFELDLELAKKMSVSFGGGVGRMREVCGTVNAMAMLAGFKYPVFDPVSYTHLTLPAALFKEKHGTIICRSLLPPEETSTNPAPSARTQQYYAKRPCGKYVEEAARIAGHMLKGELE